MTLTEQILDHAQNPRELERLYQKNPAAFREAFSQVIKTLPDSIVFAVWQERLTAESIGEDETIETADSDLSAVTDVKDLPNSSISNWLAKDMRLAVLLAVLAGLCTRVMVYLVLDQHVVPVNIFFGIVPYLAILFASKSKMTKRQRVVLTTIVLLSGIYFNVLPLKETDGIIMAYLHLPVFLWIVLGFAYTGCNYRSNQSRLDFLKFNGEFAILYACFAICGMILTAMTLSLFGISMPNLDYTQLYMENVVVIGAASLAIVAAFLVTLNLKLARSIAPYLARIFSPLVLVTLAAYLVMLIWSGKNPFLDRDFLIAFNGILLVVLAVTIFSLTESTTKSKKSLSDFLNAGLIILALAIDGVALASIVFRLSSYGLTPNRVAVLGVNILIGIHLTWILVSTLQLLRNKTGIEKIQKAVTTYLPVYGGWSAFVFLVFPWVFR